jgi:branched-subunit amino acid transport protein
VNTAYLAVAILGVALTAFAARSAFFFLPASVELPEGVLRALRHAPACALTAIVVPAVFTQHGAVFVSAHNYRIWAVIAAAVVFAKTRNMLVMMAVGLAVFTVLRLAL